MSNYSDELENETAFECKDCGNIKENEEFSLDGEKDYCDECFPKSELIRKLKLYDFDEFIIEYSDNYIGVYLLPLQLNRLISISPSKVGVSGKELMSLLYDNQIEVDENTRSFFEYNIKAYEI